MLVEMAVFQYDRPPSFWIVGFHELLQILKMVTLVSKGSIFCVAFSLRKSTMTGKQKECNRKKTYFICHNCFYF